MSGRAALLARLHPLSGSRQTPDTGHGEKHLCISPVAEEIAASLSVTEPVPLFPSLSITAAFITGQHSRTP